MECIAVEHVTDQWYVTDHWKLLPSYPAWLHCLHVYLLPIDRVDTLGILLTDYTPILYYKALYHTLFLGLSRHTIEGSFGVLNKLTFFFLLVPCQSISLMGCFGQYIVVWENVQQKSVSSCYDS